MANSPQARKRIRRNRYNQLTNKSRVSRIRNHLRKVEEAIASGNQEEARKALQAAQPQIQRGISAGILHKNTAARKISRLSNRVKKMAS
ncbi:MAG: 30S ribosomal protein S20 [Proteobacteria bacterium]|nr:30S ribosomal protein S20 [Pseudomonadota bacterium]